jgi:hypothetical protein
MKKIFLTLALLAAFQSGWTQCSDPSNFYLDPLDPVFCTGQNNQLDIMPSNWNAPLVPPFFSYWSASWEYSTDGVNWTVDGLASGSPFLVPTSLPQPYYYRAILQCSDDGSTYTMPFYLVEPIINAYIVGSTDLCPNGETELTLQIPYHDIDTLNVTSVQWNLNSDPSGLPSEITVTANQAGTYDIDMVIQNSIGNCFVASPQFELAACPSLCNGTPVGGNAVPDLSTECADVTFSLSLSGASQLPEQTYQWQSGSDGINFTDINGETNATLSTSATVSTYYRCAISCGASTDYSTYAFVSIFDAVAASGPNCAVGTNVIAVPLNGDSYQWYLDGQPIAGATTGSTPANAAGSYTVAITKGNCTLTTDPVVVNPLPDPNVTPHSAQICQGDNVQLSALPGMSSYQWYYVPNAQGNISLIPGATAQTLTTDSAGIYFVSVTNSFGCTAQANLVTFAEGAVVSVNPSPTPSISYSNPTLSVSGAFASYQWFLNGVPIPGAIGATYTPTESGSYSVEVVDENGCQGTSDPLETVVQPPYPRVVINEFDYYNPSGNRFEFIELKNVDTVAWDMSGFKIQLIDGAIGGTGLYNEIQDPIMFGMLMPNDYFVIGALNGVPDQDISPFSETFDNIKSDTGAIVLLFGNDIIDRVSYGTAVTGYAEGAPITQVDQQFNTFSRMPDGTDTDSNIEDFALVCTTPGAANSTFTACGIYNLIINEIVQDTFRYFLENSPGSHLFYTSGVELFNPTSESINLSGFRLVVEQNDEVVQVAFDGGYTTLSPLTANELEIAPGSYRVIGRFEANGPVLIDYPYNGDISFLDLPIFEYPTTISLYDPNLSLVDRVGIGTGSVSEVTPLAAVSLNTFSNYSRIPNGVDTDDNSADFKMVCATVGEANVDVFCDPNSVLELENIASTIYPNPCSEFLIVEWNGASTANFVVYDLQGRSVHNGLIQNKTDLDVSDLKNGFYLLQLQDADNRTSIQRFVKQ